MLESPTRDGAALPRYYTYKDVLTCWFAEDEDAFFAAWAAGSLPLAVRHECEATMPPRALEIGFLRLLIQQQAQLLAVQQALLDEIRRAPEVERV